MSSFPSSLSQPLLALAFLTGVTLPVLSQAQGNGANSNSTSSQADDADWNQVLAVTKLKEAAKINLAVGSQGPSEPGPTPVQTADKFRDWYSQHPSNRHVAEARRLEAVYLINAVSGGDAPTSVRMEATVATLRKDLTVPVSERAIVAGTYDFSAARQQGMTEADVLQRYEVVARGLIAEFPKEPQGYVSLLTLAMQQTAPRNRLMLSEVLMSSAPDALRVQARRLLNRVGLIGKTVDEVFAAAPGGNLGKDWEKKRPGVIYFWASWSPPSITLGESLAGSGLEKVNVVGFCLDREEATGKAAAAAHALFGDLIYLKYGAENPLAVLTGAFEAPLVYLVDENGMITDVRGQDGLADKLKKLAANKS